MDRRCQIEKDRKIDIYIEREKEIDSPDRFCYKEIDSIEIHGEIYSYSDIIYIIYIYILYIMYNYREGERDKEKDREKILLIMYKKHLI